MKSFDSVMLVIALVAACNAIGVVSGRSLHSRFDQVLFWMGLAGLVALPLGLTSFTLMIPAFLTIDSGSPEMIALILCAITVAVCTTATAAMLVTKWIKRRQQA